MDHFNYINSSLHAEDVALETVAEQVGTPFYCYSTATLTRHFRVFSEALAGLDPLICFAVKANTTLAVLKTLGREGSGADVVSAGEIRAALAAGIEPQKIIFSGVGKSREEMEYALRQNIFQFNVESFPELALLNEVASGMGKKAAIALRVNPDVEAGTHAKISTGRKETKFGIPMEDAPGMYTQAAAMPGISVQGISVHIGSQLSTLAPFATAFDGVIDLANRLCGAGLAISTVDLGGGLGIPYGDQAAPPLPAAYADIVREKFGNAPYRLIFEPGRLIAGNAGIMVSRVLYVKQGEDRVFIIVDAGMNDMMRPALYDAFHDIVPVKANPDAETGLADVVGPVCETGDIFARQRMIRIPQPGELLAFRSAGAYGASMASNYNSRLFAAEVMVNGKDFTVVKRRQNYDELFSRDAFPHWL